jgi:hypothetical protein
LRQSASIKWARNIGTVSRAGNDRANFCSAGAVRPNFQSSFFHLILQAFSPYFIPQYQQIR